MTEKKKSFELSKGKIIFLYLLFSLIVLATTTQSWFSVSATDAAAKVQAVGVQGKDASTIVSAFAIVTAAVALALTITQKTTSIVLAVFGLVTSLVTLVGIIMAMGNPHQAVRETVGKMLGSVSESQQISMGAPLYIALIAAIGMVITAALALLNVRKWKAPSHKYDRNNTSVHGDSIDSWDALTHGNDPTVGDKEAGDKGE